MSVTITSPDMLRKDTVGLIKQIDKQIKAVEAAAFAMGCKPEEVRDTNGNWVMSPLLLAKVQAISVLVQLNANAHRR